MRFKITLLPDKSNDDIILPINYQYELSAFIYRTIHAGNHEFGNWLHEKGFVHGQKSFKLFTFSRLQIPKFKQFKDRLIILSDTVFIELSFLPVKITQAFITGAFKNQYFSIGDKESKVNFSIKGIEAMEEPVFLKEMKFRTLSPVLVSTKETREDRYAKYLSPGEINYENKIKHNLIGKYAALRSLNETGTDLEMLNGFELKCTSTPRKKGVDIKANTPDKTHIIGYNYEFTISGSLELIRTGYYAGFGEKNSLGFGCCGVVQ